MSREPKVTEAKNGLTATTANRRTKIDDAFTLGILPYFANLVLLSNLASVSDDGSA